MNNNFSSALNIDLYTLSTENYSPRWLDWNFYDHGPGYFFIPDNQYLAIQIKGINDDILNALVDEIKAVDNLRYLNLAENRGITDKGIAQLAEIPQLAFLNLSSCNITDNGLAFLAVLKNLEYLNVSYCNRLAGEFSCFLQKNHHLNYLDLQGVIKINNNTLKKFERRGLTIHRY